MARLGRDISPSQAKVVVQPGDRASELRVVPYTGLTPERAARLSRIGTLLEFAAGEALDKRSLVITPRAFLHDQVLLHTAW